MTFQEYAKKRLEMEKAITASAEQQLEEESKLQQEIDEAMIRLRNAKAKSDLLAAKYEGERRRMREEITQLDLDYTEHGEP